MRVIGISNKTRYWQEYAFSNPPEGYRYARMMDVPWHVLRISNQFLAHTKFFFPFRHADIHHTYNGIVANRAPWVIEVESYLPRYRPMREDHALAKWAMRRLASNDCKAILFSSEHTARMNREKLAAAGVDPAKTAVLYRAVEHYMAPERPTDVFQVLFVGNGFYRKGGVELLKAFQRLKRPEARLRIISSMEIDWAVLPDEARQQWVRQAIASDPRIQWDPGLPHAQVVQCMRRAHVFVNTTFGDTFNNAVMEAMGCQLPVIGSGVSALPEMIEHGHNGFIIDVADQDSERIATEIHAHLERLMDDAALARTMGERSMAIARTRFDIRARNARLRAIYDRALGEPVSDGNSSAI